MSGSGSTYFLLENIQQRPTINDDYLVINGLDFIKDGVNIA